VSLGRVVQRVLPRIVRRRVLTQHLWRRDGCGESVRDVVHRVALSDDLDHLPAEHRSDWTLPDWHPAVVGTPELQRHIWLVDMRTEHEPARRRRD
jgi:hypothetical protein